MRTFKMYFFSMWSRHIVLLCTIPNAHAPLNGHSCALSRFLRDKKNHQRWRRGDFGASPEAQRLQNVHVSSDDDKHTRKSASLLIWCMWSHPILMHQSVLSSLWRCMRNIRTTENQRKKNRKISPCPIKTAPLSCLLEAERFSPYSNKSFLLESHRTHNFTWTLPAGFMSQNDIFQKQWDCTVHMQPIKVHRCFCWI